MDGRPRASSAPIYEEYASVPLEPINPPPTVPTTLQVPDRQSPAANNNAQSRPTTGTSPNNNYPRVRRPTIADRRQPSIRIRRLASSNNLREGITATDFGDAEHLGTSNRRRSSSEPQRFRNDASVANFSLPRSAGGPGSRMDTLAEEGAVTPDQRPAISAGDVPIELRRPGLLSRASTAAMSTLRMGNANDRSSQRRGSKTSRDFVFDPLDEYDARLVDLLDVVGWSSLAIGVCGLR